MNSRTLFLTTILGLIAPSLTACKVDNAAGYQVQIDLMLSEGLSPTTTVDILEDGANLGSSIKDAMVMLQLNGGTPTTVPYVEGFGYLLTGNISGAQPKGGDTVTAGITIDAKTLGDTVSVPTTPKSATSMTAQDPSKAIILTWDSATTPPDEFQIAILDQYTAADNSMGYFENIAGSATSYTIPAGTLKAATKGVHVQITSQNVHNLTGADYEPYSHFIISNAGGITFDTL